MSTLDMFSDDPVLAALMQTWPAFQSEVDTRALDTDMVRVAYPKPTVVREHENIHILCNIIDRLRAELDAAQPGQQAVDETADEVGYVGPTEAVATAAGNAGLTLSGDDARRLATSSFSLSTSRALPSRATSCWASGCKIRRSWLARTYSFAVALISA